MRWWIAFVKMEKFKKVLFIHFFCSLLKKKEKKNYTTYVEICFKKSEIDWIF